MKNRILSLISRRAKKLRDAESIPLHQARAKIVAAAGFKDDHDLHNVLKSNPDDYRLRILDLYEE